MSAPLLAIGATMMCAHGGVASAVTPTPRVRLGGKPALTATGAVIIAGCPLPPPPAGPGGCVSGRWVAGHTTRVRSLGQALLTQSSQGLAMPAGTPLIIANPGQVRVRGT